MLESFIPQNFPTLDVLATPDDKHRLWLARNTTLLSGEHPMMLFVMLNPSKARGEGVGDPTQRKCDGFATRLGALRYGFVNMFAKSTPYPEKLFDEGYDYAVGPWNDTMISQALGRASSEGWPVVAAWGKPSKLNRAQMVLFHRRVEEVLSIARRLNVQWSCLAEGVDGYPRHPLMLGYEVLGYGSAPELTSWNEGL